MPLTSSGCLFIHIPKCAGTSIEVALGVADQYPEIGFRPTSTIPSLTYLFGAGLQHLTIRELVRNYPDRIFGKNLFSFSILRRPVDRFVSYLSWKYYRFSSETASGSSLREIILCEFENLFSLSRKLEIFRNPFDGFEYCQGADCLIAPDNLMRHIIPQCCFIFMNGKINIDYLYTIDALPALEAELSRRGHIRSCIDHRMPGLVSGRLLQAIKPIEIAELESIYKFDLRLINYIRGSVEDMPPSFRRGFEVEADVLDPPPLRKLSATMTSSPEPRTLPRNLWLYWHQGWRNAPDLVKQCVSTWITRNKNWSIHLLSAENISELVELPDYLAGATPPLPALSDILRVHLLASHGGVWADATTWCTRPLDEWIDKVVTNNGFFAYSNPAPRRPLSSWFLASQVDNYIIQAWKRATDSFWQEHRSSKSEALSDSPMSSDYFWFHSLFLQLLETDPRFSELWDRRFDISADVPHYLQMVGLLAPAETDVLLHIHNKMTNVYKLSRRIDLPEQISGTVLGALFDTLHIDGFNLNGLSDLIS